MEKTQRPDLNGWRKGGMRVGEVHCYAVGKNTSRNIGSCFCVGPQNGDPVCPCRKKDVKVVDGRIVEINDLGVAK